MEVLVLLSNPGDFSQFFAKRYSSDHLCLKKKKKKKIRLPQSLQTLTITLNLGNNTLHLMGF